MLATPGGIPSGVFTFVSMTATLLDALALLVSFDHRLLDIVGLSLFVSLSALAVGTVLGMPLGALLAIASFPGRAALIVTLNALMGLPSVVVGVLVYLLLSRSGPLGSHGLLFSPSAMIIAQSMLVVPLIAMAFLGRRYGWRLWAACGMALAGMALMFHENEPWNLGDTLTVDMFSEEDWVDVTGISKGKGFQGVVKRHGFGGVGGQTHGQHNRQRKPGSLGASSYPSRVFPGKRLPGRMGGEQVKVLNLKVLKIIPENNLILVKGSIPGAKGAYLTIEK